MLIDWLGAIIVIGAIYSMLFGPKPEAGEEAHLDRDW